MEAVAALDLLEELGLQTLFIVAGVDIGTALEKDLTEGAADWREIVVPQNANLSCTFHRRLVIA